MSRSEAPDGARRGKGRPRRDALVAVAAIVLTLAGVSRAAGHLVGWVALERAGASALLAPLPDVFGSSGDRENLAQRFELVVETAEGRLEGLRGHPGVFRRLRGPFPRRNFYAEHIYLYPMPESDRTPSVLSRAFCDPGDVARELGLRGRVQHLRRERWDARDRLHSRVVDELVCTRSSS